MRISFFSTLLLPWFFICCFQTEPVGKNRVALGKATGMELPSFFPVPKDLVLVSNDEGWVWQDISAGLPADIWINTAIANAHNSLLLYSQYGLFGAQMDAPSVQWKKAALPITGKENIWAFAGRNGLYVSCENQLFYQEFGTEGWKLLSQNMPNGYVRDVLELAGGSLLITTETGIYSSTDGGTTWKCTFKSPEMVQLFAGKDGIYVSCYDDIMRSVDGGQRWDIIRSDEREMKFITRYQGRLLALIGAGSKRQVHFLESDGNTPESKKLAEELREGWNTFIDVFDLLEVGETLYCSNHRGISRSVDGGKHWVDLLVTEEPSSYRLRSINGRLFAIKQIGC